jgi:hypothetical protein
VRASGSLYLSAIWGTELSMFRLCKYDGNKLVFELEVKSSIDQNVVWMHNDHPNVTYMMRTDGVILV